MSRLAAALSVSLALHAVLLWAPSARPGESIAGRAKAQPLSVELVNVATRAAEPIAPPASKPLPLAPTERAQRVPVPELSPSKLVPIPSKQRAGSSAEPEEETNGTHYFRASELNQRAVLQTELELDFPRGSEEQDGYMVVQILINELGGVDAVRVMVSDPEGLFDETVCRAFESAKFQPGVREGLPVKSEMMVEMKIAPRF